MKRRYPKHTKQPKPDDMVQVIMTEKMARRIEDSYLAPAKGRLSEPILLAPDDLPTYIIGTQP